MKKLIFILGLLMSQWIFAGLSVEVDTTSLSLGQSFNLSLSSDNPKLQGLPDLSPLQKDFAILGTQRSSNYTLLNGKATVSSEWIINLMPKHGGKLIIPPITLGSEQTKALSIEVSDQGNLQQKATAVPEDKALFIETEVSEKAPYLKEQVLYTVRFYNSLRLIDLAYQAPEIEGALLIRLGEPKQYQRYKDNRLYTVEEQRYAIFAQKVGSLTLKPPRIKAMSFDLVPETFQLEAKPLTLKVKPAQGSLDAWLPAKKLELSENYDRNDSQFTQGDTLVRTIDIKAEGLPAELLPEIKFNKSSEFNLYPEKAIESNQLLGNDLLGSSKLKLTYLLNKAGKVVIPAQTLSWFNTLSGKEENAVLPERILQVKAAPLDSTITPPLDSEPKKEVSVTKVKAEIKQGNLLAWILALSFGLAWIVTLALWLKGKKKVKKAKDPLNSKNTEEELQRACESHQAQEARFALLNWAKSCWPNTSFLTLADLRSVIEDEAFLRAIDDLSQSLYQEKKTWQGQALWQAFLLYKKKAKTKKTIIVEELPPLNP